MRSWLTAVVFIATSGCGGQPPAPKAPTPKPAVVASECRDWVRDTAGHVAWKQDGDDDEILTFKGTTPDSDFFAFKGAGPIDAPIGKVANVLIDTTRHREWVPHFGGMRVVRNVSKAEKVIYRHVITPIVISDRDFVVKARISKESRSGHLLVQFSSVEDENAPKVDGKVRGTLHTSGYRMWPLDDGARTMMIFTIHVDPMGDVPAWIVNLFQSNYARSNIQNIRRQAAKPDVQEHAEVRAQMADYAPACSPKPRPPAKEQHGAPAAAKPPP